MNLYPQAMTSKHRQAMKSPRYEALCHFDKGVDHQQCGCLEEAKTSYLLAIKADQSLAAAYNNLGFICMRMGDYVTAAKQFQQVVRLEPHNVEAFHNLSYLYEKQDMTGTAKTFYMIAELEGNFAQAQRYYLTAADLNDSSAYAYFCLALLYERMEFFDEAIAAYHAALNCDPCYLKALFNVARVYHTQRAHDQAIRYFERVLELDPQHAQAHNNLGHIYEEIGKCEVYPIVKTI
jgi:tetratricopeptide (TPR) repeat protein